MLQMRFVPQITLSRVPAGLVGMKGGHSPPHKLLPCGSGFPPGHRSAAVDGGEAG